MSMKSDQEIEKFLREIKGLFPEVSLRIDLWLEHLGCRPEDKMYTAEMEAFSQATTDAIKSRDEERATRYLNYMSQKLNGASAIEREYIDVYYVESLLWDIRDRKLKVLGWSLIPSNLKALYIGMWGTPDF